MRLFVMSLFVMSLFCWIVWKLFAGKQETVFGWVFVTGNILASLLFAAGHLPATVSLFQGLDILIVLRCFVLNGLPGFCFGLLYQKYGLQYAIFCHMACHLWFKFMLMLII